MNDTASAAPSLLPCPFCGGGVTLIHVNKGTWSGSGYGEPVSVEVRHWCESEQGQPSRMISRAGRDEASAIAAWNRRAQETPPAVVEPLTDEAITAAARVLCERQADACGIDRDDQWMVYGDGFKEDARAMLIAAHGIKKGEGNGN